MQSRGSFVHCDNLIKYDADAEDIFGSLQEAMTHAADLAKFFFPAMNKHSQRDLMIARTRSLRDEYGIGDDHPLANRDLRNKFEHFYENLDLFLLKNDSGCFLPMPIVGDYRLQQDPVGNIFKLIDPQNQHCVLLGEVFDYGSIRASIEVICASFESD